jgi:hypothetical protein
MLTEFLAVSRQMSEGAAALMGQCACGLPHDSPKLIKSEFVSKLVVGVAVQALVAC